MDMRYLIFIMGFDQSDKTNFESNLEDLNFEKIKYVYTSDSVILHVETVRSRELLKTQIHQISENYFCWYFMSEFIDKLSCNLDDDTARYLFDFDYNLPKEDDFEFDIKFTAEDDDEDDVDLVQMLKEKYNIKENEPTLDEILDKINQKGVSSLSFQEQAILKNYN